MIKEVFEIEGIYENGTLKIMSPLPQDSSYFVKIKFYKPFKRAEQDYTINDFNNHIERVMAQDYLKASESSIDFWDNDIDNLVWNDV
ncbi:MAG: hypothetical protein GX121_01645 [Ignavibacteria bacterium]|jgi:hypothetical protein|nr:hypothetical protein [Ignavibacteria bacterium]